MSSDSSIDGGREHWLLEIKAEWTQKVTVKVRCMAYDQQDYPPPF